MCEYGYYGGVIAQGHVEWEMSTQGQCKNYRRGNSLLPSLNEMQEILLTSFNLRTKHTHTHTHTIIW